MMEKKLKPCPFCGEKLVHDSEYYSGPIWQRNIRSYRVECPKCEACTNDYLTAEEAIRAWNNRPIEDKLRTEISYLAYGLEVYDDD